jgi:hypothetical protein
LFHSLDLRGISNITTGSIDFAEFLKVIENQKERAENFDDESDMIDAFVACGGQQGS